MIYKNIDFGKTKNMVIAEFGTGDIQMIGSKISENGYVSLAFKTSEKQNEINVVSPNKFKSFDEMKPEIVFSFNNTKSIDSLISMLKDIKKELNNSK